MFQSREQQRSSAPVFRVFRRILQDFRLHHPHAKVGGNLDHEGFATLIQAVQKFAGSTVEFIARPGPDTHAVGLRAIDQLQRELGLRAKLDIVWDVRFFRRAGSLAHSSGRYSRASSSTLNPGAEYDNAT